MLVVSLSQESLMKEKFSLKHIMVYFPRKGWPTNRLSTNQPFVDIGCTKDRLRRGYWGYTHPTFRRNPNNWYKNTCWWADDHPQIYWYKWGYFWGWFWLGWVAIAHIDKAENGCDKVETTPTSWTDFNFWTQLQDDDNCKRSPNHCQRQTVSF